MAKSALCLRYHRDVTNLVDQLATMDVVTNKDLGPQLRLATLDEITSLLLEHGILVGDSNELVIAEAFSVCDVSQVGVSLLAELSNYEWFVELRHNSERL